MRTGVALATSIILAVALVLGGARPVRADDAGDEDEKAVSQGKVVVDVVEVTPSRLGLSRVRALVSAIDFNGKRISIVGDPAAKSKAVKGAVTIKVGSAKPSPALPGFFESSDIDLALVVVLPVTYDFDTDLPAIKEHVKTELLAPLQKQLGPRAQVAIIGYAEGTSGSRKLGNMNAALSALDGLEIDSTPPNLLAATQRAVTLVKNAIKKPKNPGALVRGAVVLISDGNGVSTEERAAVTKLGQTASKDRVRIHAIAYSPSGRKRPLFNLGELSRQSNGTFRWVRTEGGWGDQLGRVLDELLHQTVLTFFAPPEELADKKLVVGVPIAGKTLESDAVKVPDPTCSNDPCDGYCARGVCVMPARATGGGVMQWVMIGGGGVLGLGLLLGVGTMIARRKKGPPMPMPGATMPGAIPGVPGAAQMFGAPGVPAVPGMPAAAAPIAAGAPIFVLVNGPNAGQRVALKNGFTIGKAPGSDLDLGYDGFASTNHAMVTFDGQSWWLIDRGSTNGTYVNGNRIQQIRLDPGITVRLGSTEVRFATA